MPRMDIPAPNRISIASVILYIFICLVSTIHVLQISGPSISLDANTWPNVAADTCIYLPILSDKQNAFLILK